MSTFTIDRDRLARYQREADAAGGVYAACQQRADDARRELRAAAEELERLEQSGPGYHSADYLAALAANARRGEAIELDDLGARHDRRVDGARKRLDAARAAHQAAQADLADASAASQHARALFERLRQHAEAHRRAGGASNGGLMPRLRKMFVHTDPGGRING